jgi:hypothetical protein
MSFDLNLSTVCNHRIYREVSTLEADRKFLRMTYPLASATSIDLYASNNEVPKTDYTIIFDPTATTSEQLRMISFKSKWRSVEDYFEISYNTLRGYCSKCMGRNTLEDVSYDVRGQLSTIVNEYLLIQNVEKFTVTQMASNPFHTYVGTNISNMIGKRISDIGLIITNITSEIQTTLAKFKDLQQQYVRTGRPVTNGELLDRVLEVRVAQDTNDPTIVRADVSVTAKSGKTLSYTQYIQVTGT